MNDPYSLMFCFGSIFGAAITLIAVCVASAIVISRKMHDDKI